MTHLPAGMYQLLPEKSEASAAPNSLDSSGGGVFRIMIRPAMLDWIRAARLTQPLDR